MLEYILDKLDRLLKEVERMSITEYNEFYTNLEHQLHVMAKGKIQTKVIIFDIVVKSFGNSFLVILSYTKK